MFGRRHVGPGARARRGGHHRGFRINTDADLTDRVDDVFDVVIAELGRKRERQVRAPIHSAFGKSPA